MSTIANKVRLISWSRWEDPMGRNRDQIEYVPEKDVKKFDNDRNDVFDEEEDDEGLADEPSPVVITPMGILPLRPWNDPTKVFNFWLGETNFDITGEVTEILNDIPGVEILDIFTRYKFRIAVGNNFKFQDVRQAIELALDAVPHKTENNDTTDNVNITLDDDTKTKIQQIIKTQLAQYPLWALYVCPNGQIDMIGSEEKTKEFNERIEMYTEAKRLAGGYIYKNDGQPV